MSLTRPMTEQKYKEERKMPERISKDTLRAKVKKYILKRISTGVYKPGERVVETRIAKELEMSQAPVREAILELSIMGILEERPYSGSFVQQKDPNDINDYFSIREMIEAYAASLAAVKRTEEDLYYMRSVLKEMEDCVELDDFTDLDIKFHESILQASKNKVLTRTWQAVSAYEWTYESILAINMTIEELIESHRELYRAIEEGIANAAGAKMLLHIDGFKESILKALKEDTIK